MKKRPLMKEGYEGSMEGNNANEKGPQSAKVCPSQSLTRGGRRNGGEGAWE